MSGSTITGAPGITIEQVEPPSSPYALASGVPPYPLASDPGQTWSLQSVNGVLTWVRFTAAPGQAALALEEGAGSFLLEDGDGYLLMEL